MRWWLDFGSANTGITEATLTRCAHTLSDGLPADLATDATLTEVDSTNLPGVYIFDAPSVTANVRGRAFKTGSPAIWAPIVMDNVSVAVAGDAASAGDLVLISDRVAALEPQNEAAVQLAAMSYIQCGGWQLKSGGVSDPAFTMDFDVVLDEGVELCTKFLNPDTGVVTTMAFITGQAVGLGNITNWENVSDGELVSGRIPASSVFIVCRSTPPIPAGTLTIVVSSPSLSIGELPLTITLGTPYINYSGLIAFRVTDSKATVFPAAASTLDSQAVRDALKLAPSAGAADAGSIDDQLAAIVEDTGTTLPASIASIGGSISTGTSVVRVLEGDEIKLVRGDVSTITFNLGTAYNLTGKTATLTVKKTPTDTAANAILSAACTTTDAANGVCTYTTATTSFPNKGRYYFDVQVAVTGTGASPITAAIGKITVLQDVNN